MHSFFMLHKAVDFFTFAYVVPLLPLVFELEKIGDFSDIPDDHIHKPVLTE